MSPDLSNVTHRDHLGPTYRGIHIHALSGLHEYAAKLADKFFSKEYPILELGAGSGALSLRLQDNGYKMNPVDLDGMDWKLDIPLVEADLNQPRWYDEKLKQKNYQQIIALEIIEHLENPSKFFRDIADILPSGGRLILSTPNVFTFPSIHAAFKRGEFALFSPEDCITSGHISILPWWLLRHLSERAGLRVIHCSGVCDIPISGLKKFIVAGFRFIRRQLFVPRDFKNFEGLNVVMVFEKTLEPIS
jgi:2-polyprenyl-3-methyl-5-hydroxy-6-metoxy-1,4-benzoquinol methylase